MTPAEIISRLTAADIEAWLRALPPRTAVGRCRYPLSCLISMYVLAVYDLDVWINPSWGEGVAGVPGPGPGTPLPPEVAELGRAFDRIDGAGRTVSAARALRRLFGREVTS